MWEIWTYEPAWCLSIHLIMKGGCACYIFSDLYIWWTFTQNFQASGMAPEYNVWRTVTSWYFHKQFHYSLRPDSVLFASKSYSRKNIRHNVRERNEPTPNINYCMRIWRPINALLFCSYFFFQCLASPSILLCGWCDSYFMILWK